MMKRALLALSLAALASGASGQQRTTTDHAQLRWACGGATADERHALAQLETQANLMLVFVGRKGRYLSHVDLTIYGLSGGAPRLNVHVNGPICAIRVPPGQYRIEASLRSTTLRIQATVPDRSRRRTQVVFSFPGDTRHHVWT